MQKIRVYTERRSAPASADCPGPNEGRTYCWSIERCAIEVRERCHAFIVQENCWDFWVLKGARFKACCHRLADCSECPIVQHKFPDTFQVHVRVPPARHVRRDQLQSYLCSHLHFLVGDMPRGPELRRLLKASQETDHELFRCRRRGAYLDVSYVDDICLTRRGRECVFL